METASRELQKLRPDETASCKQQTGKNPSVQMDREEEEGWSLMKWSSPATGLCKGPKTV